MKYILLAALLLPGFAIASDIESVTDACEAKTLQTIEELKAIKVQLDVKQSLKLFKSCVLVEADLEGLFDNEEHCHASDDRCYP